MPASPHRCISPRSAFPSEPPHAPPIASPLRQRPLSQHPPLLCHARPTGSLPSMTAGRQADWSSIFAMQLSVRNYRCLLIPCCKHLQGPSRLAAFPLPSQPPPHVNCNMLHPSQHGGGAHKTVRPLNL
ncbi:hypothetical protein Pmani_004216 [Petrolisthes manimaculis]|uniref:Uncharacterized protein n=1 Tax=Petrolisthes manimaculis TaxID=1843537 RepID=A0AAE1NSQ1_9EUCA|nr:hypothetical protein Pmani_032657 [Petrolisthes manimaculis]KAK4325190.1 hypothetical protein Pmani_004216 [Petrolisthes manimaculis]